MLIYTHKLEQYVLHKILPMILLGKKYKIKGSFKRKIPYITDIDIVNYVNPEINKTNIRNALIKLIESIKPDNANHLSESNDSSVEKNEEYTNPQIRLIYVTCGTDPRFKLDTGSIDEITKLKTLLKEKEIVQLDKIINTYASDPEKKLFYINEMIRPMYKLRWEPKKIIENKMKTRGNHIITFDSVIQNNCSLILRYFIDIKSIPIGFDVATYYEKVNCVKIYEDAAKRTLKLSNYKKDYYYMLFPFKYYFRSDPVITAELETIIEKKFGLHKQLMVRIDTYHLLYISKNLNIKTATNIIISIIQSIESNIPDITKSNTLNMIKKTATNNTPETKMADWDIQLDVLYDEILGTANIECKDYFFKYLELIPPAYRKECCI